MYEERKQDDSLESLSPPQSRPLNIYLNGDSIAIYCRDKPIVRVTAEDYDTLYSAINLLNGIVGNELSLDEIKEVRNILLEVVGS
jgi:hypothetical protein